MVKIRKAIVGFVMGALVFASAGLAIAMSDDDAAFMAEQRLKRACQHKVSARMPNGKRDMKVLSYSLESPYVGVARGSFRTEFRPGRWTPLTWTCRLSPTSGRILSVEFGWTSRGSRLLAAAQLRR